MPNTLQPSHSSVTIQLADEIDLANATAVGDALCDALRRADAGIVVDLSKVTFIDSSAIAMMFRVHHEADRVDKSVTWQGAQPTPARVLQIVGAGHVLNLAD